MAKNTFILYKDIINMVSRLDNERKGVLFQTILDYVNGNDIPDDIDIAVDAVFAGIKANIDINDAEYVKTCEERAKAGAKGGKAKADKSKQKVAIAKSDKQKVANGSKPKQTLPDTETDTDIDTDTVTDTETYTESPSETNPSSSANADVLSPLDMRFEEFWRAYPKKKAKGDAKKAWKKIKPSAQMLDTILNALEVAKSSKEWAKEHGQFIPYPATWLRAEGWEDEYETNRASPKDDWDEIFSELGVTKGVNTDADG